MQNVTLIVSILVIAIAILSFINSLKKKVCTYENWSCYEEDELNQIDFPVEPTNCTTWSCAHFGTIRADISILKRSAPTWKFWHGHYEISEASNELRLILMLAAREAKIDYDDERINLYLKRYGHFCFSPIL